MLRKIFLPIVLIFVPVFQVKAQQNGVLIGVVRDASTKEPLPGVNVVLDEVTGVVTDVAGKYSLDISPGDHIVSFRLIGYTTINRKLSVSPGEARILNIDLSVESTTLNTVVVSAGKFEQKLDEVTVSMEVIRPALIENTNTTSMDDVMEQVPGVTVIEGQANIRGGSGFSYGAGSRVLLLVNDLPLLSADAGDIKWNFLPVENIEQVEVIKGASSALFGSSAMNGIINIRTAYPKNKPETKINYHTGFYDTPKREDLKWWEGNLQQTQGLSFIHSRKAGDIDLVLAGNVFNDDGYRQGESENRYRLNANSRYRFKKTEGLYAGLNANITYSKSGIFFLWQNDSSGAYIPQGGLNDSTTTISFSETTRTSIDPFVTYSKPGGSTHKLRMRYFKSANKNNTNQESFAGSYYGEYQYQKKIFDKVTITTGLVDIYSDIRSELYEDHFANNIAVFAQADAAFGKFNFSVGGRMESNSVDGGDEESIPVVRSGINYKFLEHSSIRASYGQGYRYPSIAERFISTNVGSIVIYPNDSLESETGWTAEIGIKQGLRIGGWQGYLDMAGFWSEYEDMLEFAFGKYGEPTDPFFGLGFQSVNIGNTKITGFEIGLTGEGTIGRIPVTILCGYTYIDPVQKDFNPVVDTLKNSAPYNILKYRYRHTFKGDIEFNPGKLMLGISTRYNSFMENIDAVFESPATIAGVQHYREKHDYGDWVFDLRTGYRINEMFRISLIVKNLFNHEYMERPADMQPPRSFTMQLAFRF